MEACDPFGLIAHNLLPDCDPPRKWVTISCIARNVITSASSLTFLFSELPLNRDGPALPHDYMLFKLCGPVVGVPSSSNIGRYAELSIEASKSKYDGFSSGIMTDPYPEAPAA
ncbi:hypothetical protein TIFTF001_055790 [Ficus carica]|uniref:Uncharacterized protein n=1 Tax=Ficus carica TaxID=3494 RepID=A0AA88JJ46_FICCA|nr:hypothetical protein TIFTF001_055790 [Ficus carica]